MNIATYSKEEPAVTDYEIDWSAWLDGRTLTSSVWSISPVAGITIVATSNTTTVATVRLSSGTWGQTYIATNHIIASDAEEEERSITIKIQQEQKYCTTTEVRRRAAPNSATLTALPEAELEALIEQASRYLDLACGVPAGYFNPPAFPFATNQTFYGDGSNYLLLAPYVPASLNATITVPDGYTAPTFLERDGYLIITSNGVLPPFPRFYSCNWYGWAPGVAVTVSAIWGFQDVNAEIKMATIEMALNLWRETDPAQVKLINIDNQPLRESIPPRVLEVARKYRFKASAVFA